MPTVTQFIARMLPILMEDSALSTGVWNIAEVINYTNDIQSDFARDTQCLKQYNLISGGAVAGQRLYSDPADSMQIDRIDFNGKPLYRTSRHMLDLEDRQWKTKSGTPKRYHTDFLNDRKTFEFDRAPTAAMAAIPIGVLSTELPTDVTVVGSFIDLPDHVIPYLQWGVLAKLFGKQGENQDLARANYCESRYLWGVSLYRRLMGAELQEAGTGVN